MNDTSSVEGAADSAPYDDPAPGTAEAVHHPVTGPTDDVQDPGIEEVEPTQSEVESAPGTPTTVVSAAAAILSGGHQR